MVWTGSSLEDLLGVLGLYTSLAGAFTYAAEGDLSALNMLERCCKGANYKLGGEKGSRLMAGEELFKMK